MQRELEVDGIQVTLTRKRVKNVNMRLKGAGKVQVSAPPWVSEKEILSFVRSKKSWIEKRQQKTTLSDSKNSASVEEIAAWRAAVEQEVPVLIAKWESIMGVKSQKIAYRNMTSRWGSCNPSTGRICINIQLARYPHECLEYVVVHELCHLRERGHGPRFKSLMTHYLPDWQYRRSLLK